MENRSKKVCHACQQHQQISLPLFIFILLSSFFYVSYAAVGTAARYKTPYAPTACYGNDPSQFPANQLFAAAGEGIWDNGAACGRQYSVSCISAPAPSSCTNSGSSIQVKIVDRATTSKSHPSSSGAALVLSIDAFEQLVTLPSATFVNIQYRQI